MKILIIPILFIISYNTSAQPKGTWGFVKATIQFKEGDSIKCLVQKQIPYTQTLRYKLTDQDPIEEIPLSQITRFRADTQLLVPVPLYNNLLLMELVDSGKISLYKFSELQYGETQVEKRTGLKSRHVDIAVRYVLNKSGATQEIKEPTFQVILRQAFSDCQRISNRIKRGGYLFEEMPQIFKDYNNCKGLYCPHSPPLEQ